MSKNINPREKAEKKQKIKNVLFKVIHGISYVCTGLFVAVCIVSCATSQRKQVNAEIYPSEIQYRIDDTSEIESSSEVSYPIYDDVNEEITLSTYQLNNYTFENLANYVNGYNEIDFGGTLILYNNNISEWSYTDFVANEYVSYELDSNTINFYLDSSNNNTFGRFILSSGNFINNLTWALDVESGYSSIKTAIQSDIQANEQDLNVSIFGGITQSVTSFIGTLNSGLTAIIGIFWNSTTSNLTPLGILTALVVGVALTYFVFRLIIGLIRLRG